MRHAFAALSVAALLAPAADAQCPGWLDLVERTGFGAVSALTTWQSPDGMATVAAGAFREYNGQPFNGVAVRQHGEWLPLGLGLNNTVSTAVDFDGNLVVAGKFTASGATPLARVARWNGTSWQPMGSSLSGDVFQLIEFQDNIYAIGTFGTFVSRWNGSTWINPGAALNNLPRAAVVHGDQLVVVGDFTMLGVVSAPGAASWNGSTWTPIGNGLPTGVKSVASIGGSLYAAGFSTGSVGFVVRLDGSTWIPMATGLAMRPRSIFGWNGMPAVVGDSSGLEPRSIQTWSGASWEDGATNEPLSISAALPIADGLMIGGGFIGGVATLRDGSWSHERHAFDGDITALGEYGGDLIIGGNFRLTPDGPVVGIARFNGHTFEPLGNGLRGSIDAIRTVGDTLYVAGSVRHDDTATYSSNIVSWDGEQWTTVSAFDALLQDATELNGEVYAAGSFSGPGGFVPVARRTASGWEGLPDISGGGTSITSWNSLLIASGTFIQAGEHVVQGIAAWNGSEWLDMEEGLVGHVIDVATHNGNLYASVNTAPPNWPAAGVMMRWNGAQWQQDYDALGQMTQSDGRLIATVSTQSGPDRFTFILERFSDGWREVAPGIGARTDVYTAFPFRDETVIGGGFLNFGPNSSIHLARWSPDGAPDLVMQPEGVTGSCPRVDATFATITATGYGEKAFAWWKDGIPLSDGAGPGGSIISGAHTSTLTVHHAGLAMEGDFACRVANECGVTWSDPASLSVCTANFNCDGEADILDLLDFLDSFGQCEGQPAPCAPLGIEADLNGDTIIDIVDFLDFLDAFGTGCD